MADINDLANTLFGRTNRSSSKEITETSTIYGKAVSDSYNGNVKVTIDGYTTNPESKPSTWADYQGVDWASQAGYSWATLTNGNGDVIELPTSPTVRNGDTVIITLVGTSVMKRPYVSAVIGSGDRATEETDKKLEEQKKENEKSLTERVDEALEPFRKDYDEFVKSHQFTDDEITKKITESANGTITTIEGKMADNNATYDKKLEDAVTLDAIKRTLGDTYVETTDSGYKYIQENQSKITQTVDQVSSVVSGHENLSDAITNIADEQSSTMITQTNNNIQAVFESVVKGQSTYVGVDGKTYTNALGTKATNAANDASAAKEDVEEVKTYFDATSDGLGIYKSNSLVRVYLGSDGKYYIQNRSSTTSDTWTTKFTIDGTKANYTRLYSTANSANAGFIDFHDAYINMSAEYGLQSGSAGYYLFGECVYSDSDGNYGSVHVTTNGGSGYYGLVVVYGDVVGGNDNQEDRIMNSVFVPFGFYALNGQLGDKKIHAFTMSCKRTYDNGVRVNYATAYISSTSTGIWILRNPNTGHYYINKNGGTVGLALLSTDIRIYNVYVIRCY